MNAAGIDVSSRKSTVAVLRPFGEVVKLPFDIIHSVEGFASLVQQLKSIEGETRIVMEHTGRYYESFAMSMYRAGFFVSAVNPLAIKGYQEGISVRKVKTDKADALKIAQFAIDKWEILPHYTPMDTIRYDLKTLHRQFQLSSKTKTALNNNLIALLEQSYPGANRYQKWCKRHGYNFSEAKAVEIHEDARQRFPLVPKSDTCKLMVREAVAQLNAVSRTVETYRAEMDRLASQLPEYETVMAMTGVGKSMGPQLIAEIGDLRRFAHQKSLVGFASTDPIKDDSGDKVSDSKPSSKRGSPYLRRTLFVIMTILLQLQPPDDPVYQFLDKKRSEGKPYYVYMTAGMTKFLRIYYGKVRDCLKEKGLWEQPNVDEVNPV